jgi:transcriptional antiterminator NusG
METSTTNTVKQNMKFYTIRVVNNKERKVKDRIELEVRRNNLEKYVGQVVIPIEKVYNIKDGKKTVKEKLIFPGYIMIEAHLNGEVKDMVKFIDGSIGFVGDGGQPTPMKQHEIDKMMGDLKKTNEVVDVNFTTGEKIKIVEGAFNTFTGVIDFVNHEKEKLQVTVTIFGKKTPLELSFAQVEKA